jgi:uncharacterized protein YebE (UPF0316 family)
MIFVLITILLTGIVSASLINKTLLNKKIQDNYINKQKASLTARAGVILLGDFLKNDNNVNNILDLNFGRDYNIIINMENDNKYKDDKIYVIEGIYRDNKHTINIDGKKYNN